MTSACSTGSRAGAAPRRTARWRARGLLARDAPLRPRLQALLRPHGLVDRELTTDEWRDAIDQCVALGAGSFVFIGGDPLMRDDFVELIDHVTGRHQAKARFFFNCLIDEGRPWSSHGPAEDR